MSWADRGVPSRTAGWRPRHTQDACSSSLLLGHHRPGQRVAAQDSTRLAKRQGTRRRGETWAQASGSGLRACTPVRRQEARASSACAFSEPPAASGPRVETPALDPLGHSAPPIHLYDSPTCRGAHSTLQLKEEGRQRGRTPDGGGEPPPAAGEAPCSGPVGGVEGTPSPGGVTPGRTPVSHILCLSGFQLWPRQRRAQSSHRQPQTRGQQVTMAVLRGLQAVTPVQMAGTVSGPSPGA